ncbi:RDD family protein [Vacuolonema iberomarrocanum]|uniref:RDD family protein n=1 Tax=Vacuolonema iberomarrocanum TaxID=3454632 RepID=UPI001A0F750D|nr:RDD family protein [filamentous cyanobacterium LEGE 07170]
MRYNNRFTLSTPESVELEFALAGIGNRVFALFIDYQVLGLILIGHLIVWIFASIQLLDYLTRLEGDFSSVPLWLLAIFLIFNFSIFVGYFVFFEVRWQGQTPGKRLAKIRVVRDDGRPVGLNQAVLRSLLRPVDDVFFIGLFFILLNKQEKRIGDLVAGTLVVQEERDGSKTDILCSERAQQLARELPETSDLDHLTPDDFAVIRAYLRRRNAMTSRSQVEVSMKLAQQIRELIKFEVIPPNMTSEDFLEALYLVYQERSPRFD